MSALGIASLLMEKTVWALNAKSLSGGATTDKGRNINKDLQSHSLTHVNHNDSVSYRSPERSPWGLDCGSSVG